MPESEKNAYEVLGISRTASLDDIKKRYRELARQYHPDVNQSNPAASKLFAKITTAYKTLSDTESRTNYDAELSAIERAAAARATPRTMPNTRTAGQHTASAAPTTTAPPPQTNAAESARLVNEAQGAFARNRFVEARALSEQALRYNRKNDKAYEILGDIYRHQGKTDEAINNYSMSLQLNPRNPALMQRLERLTRMSATEPVGPSAQRVFFDNGPPRSAPPPARSMPNVRTRPASPRQDYSSLRSTESRRSLGLLLVGFVGYVSVLMMLVWAALYHGDAPLAATQPIALVNTWNPVVWTVLPLSGLLLGFTMTITGAIRRIEDELILTGAAPRTGFFLPLGLVIILISVVNFYLAALIYATVSLLQESFTKSMMRVFGAVVAVVACVALVYAPGSLQVALWGGNIVFLCYIIGWLIGDVFRPANV